MLYQAYGVKDWHLKFGVVDWRDDEVIEMIRDQRIRNGSWTLNRARADIGEPAVAGGDDAILIDRQNMVLWSDLKDLSNANLAAVQASGQPKNMMQAPDTAPSPNVTNKTSPAAKKPGQVLKTHAAPKATSGTESVEEDDND